MSRLRIGHKIATYNREEHVNPMIYDVINHFHCYNILGVLKVDDIQPDMPEIGIFNKRERAEASLFGIIIFNFYNPAFELLSQRDKEGGF